MKTNHTKDEQPDCCYKCWKNKPHPENCFTCQGEGSYPATCVDSNCECHTKDEQSEVRGVENFIKSVNGHRLIQKGEKVEATEGEVILSVYGLGQALTHLQEQHEREKRELYNEFRELFLNSEYFVGIEETANIALKIKTIANHHGLSTKEN